MSAVKYDEDKPRTDLLPSNALISASKVFGYGADKYTRKKMLGEFNYKKGKGLDHTRVFASIQRHLIAWNNNEDIDKESKMPHLWHACCGIMMLIDLIESSIGSDTRFRGQQN